MLREMGIKEGQGFGLCFSVQSRDSFLALEEFRSQILQVKEKQFLPMIVIATVDCDSEHKKRDVTNEEGKAFAEKYNLGYYEVSLKVDEMYPIFEDLSRIILQQFGSKMYKISKGLKLVFLGDGGCGKSTLIKACRREAKIIKGSIHGIETTPGIEIQSGKNALKLDQTVDYQVWDFGGQMEYGTIHRHFVSNYCVYVVVVALVREIEPQLSYWMEFLLSHVNMATCRVIIVGTKVDMLPSENKKQILSDFKNLCINTYTQIPIHVSSYDNIKIDKLKIKIDEHAQNIVTKYHREGKENNNLINFMTVAKNSLIFVFRKTSLAAEDLEYLSNIGEIIASPKGWICAYPERLAKLMSIFVCPDTHENSLLNFITELSRPRHPIVQKQAVYDKIKAFLENESKTKDVWFVSSTSVIENIIEMLIDMKFMFEMKSLDDNIKNNNLFVGDVYLFPTLRSLGSFRWSISAHGNDYLTLGRRIFPKHSITAFEFFSFQLKLVLKSKLLAQPVFYSNGLQMDLPDKSLVLVLLSDSKKHIDIIIRGFNVMSTLTTILSITNKDDTMYFISPDDIFKNKKTFPLKLDHLDAYTIHDLLNFDSKLTKEMKEGKSGEVFENPPYMWSYINNVEVNTPDPDHQPLCYLELTPEMAEKNPLHRDEFNRVSNAFYYYVGFGKQKFKITKVLLLHNPVLEARFLKTYNEFAARNKNNINLNTEIITVTETTKTTDTVIAMTSPTRANSTPPTTTTETTLPPRAKSYTTTTASFSKPKANINQPATPITEETATTATTPGRPVKAKSKPTTMTSPRPKSNPTVPTTTGTPLPQRSSSGPPTMISPRQNSITTTPIPTTDTANANSIPPKTEMATMISPRPTSRVKAFTTISVSNNFNRKSLPTTDERGAATISALFPPQVFTVPLTQVNSLENQEPKSETTVMTAETTTITTSITAVTTTITKEQEEWATREQLLQQQIQQLRHQVLSLGATPIIPSTAPTATSTTPRTLEMITGETTATTTATTSTTPRTSEVTTTETTTSATSTTPRTTEMNTGETTTAATTTTTTSTTPRTSEMITGETTTTTTTTSATSEMTTTSTAMTTVTTDVGETNTATTTSTIPRTEMTPGETTTANENEFEQQEPLKRSKSKKKSKKQTKIKGATTAITTTTTELTTTTTTTTPTTTISTTPTTTTTTTPTTTTTTTPTTTTSTTEITTTTTTTTTTAMTTATTKKATVTSINKTKEFKDAWRQLVLSRFSNSVQNVSGDETTNLVLGWHGGCEAPKKVAQTNFRSTGPGVKKMDTGFFGNGIYFTQFLSYSDVYMKEKEMLKRIEPGEPLILSWIIMGKPYPVIEHADDPESLRNKSCVTGYDSHYVLVKDSQIPGLLDFQPCHPEHDLPDFDEVVIFNPDQILPRYLVYYDRIEETNENIIVCWVDESFDKHKGIIEELKSKGVTVHLFTSTSQFKAWSTVYQRTNNIQFSSINNNSSNSSASVPTPLSPKQSPKQLAKQSNSSNSNSSINNNNQSTSLPNSPLSSPKQSPTPSPPQSPSQSPSSARQHVGSEETEHKPKKSLSAKRANFMKSLSLKQVKDGSQSALRTSAPEASSSRSRAKTNLGRNTSDDETTTTTTATATTATKIKIISGNYRKGDGDETAGVRLFQWILRNEWKSLPFLIYCNDISQVIDMPKSANGTRTDKEKVLMEWVFS